MSDRPFFTSRRDFLTGSFTFLSAASTLPLFLGKTAQVLAVDDPKKPGKQDGERILVVVQLAGGNDGLNTVVPYEMDAYYKYRPQLAIPKKEVLKLEKGVGLHPAATGLKELFDDGKMAVIQGVGYPNPNRSHFTSMDIWHSGDPQQKLRNGWLGRYFDACCKGNDPDPEPIQGIALMQESPLALQGDRFAPLAFNNPDSLTWQAGNRDAQAAETFKKLNNINGDFPLSEPRPQGRGQSDGSKPDLADYLQRAALKAQVGADDIRTAAAGANLRNNNRPGGRGGRGDLDRSLDFVTKMIAADLPTRIYYVSMGGFDTHAGQQGRHRQLMDQLGDALKGFVNTLKENNLLDRVLIVTFSEFGRRVQENASGGTDHGEAAPMFVFGSKIKPGVHGNHPDLANLHRGDLSFQTDFRQVYAAVLQHWLNTKPDKVLGGNFAPLNLVRTT